MFFYRGKRGRWDDSWQELLFSYIHGIFMKNPLHWQLISSQSFFHTYGKYTDRPIYSRNDSLKCVEDLRVYIQRRVRDNPNLVIAFGWPPAAGKSKYSEVIQSAILSVLSKIDHLYPFFSYINPHGQKSGVWGFIGKESIFALFAADHYFQTIGLERSTSLISGIETYASRSTHYGAGFSVARDIFSWVEPEERVYTGTNTEKDQKMRLWEIVFHKRPKKWPDSRKVIVVEWVNAWIWLNKTQKVQERLRFHALEILFNMSIEDSFIRTLRRDHYAKWYSFSRILEQRLREYYYIFRLYLEPAFRNPWALLFSKTRDIPPFSHAEWTEIIQKMQELRTRFLRRTFPITPDHRVFVDAFSTSLLKQLRSMPTFSDTNMAEWHNYKRLKDSPNTENQTNISKH